MRRFRYSEWLDVLQRYEGAFRYLSHLVEEHPLLDDIAGTLFPEQTSTSGYATIDEILDEQDRMSFAEGVRDAHALLAQQTLVALVSLIEAAIRDYLECLFVQYPDRMYGYTPTKQNGLVFLGDLIQARTNTVESFLASLAKQAARNVASGSATRLLRELQGVAKRKLDQPIVESLYTLFARRNKIVHEFDDTPVVDDDIHSAFVDCETAVRQLYEWAVLEGFHPDLKALADSVKL